jgi:enoyl-CoA hydratase
MADAVAGPPTLHLAPNGVATLSLQRPQHLNRLHREDLLALQTHLESLANNGAARVLVLAATGRIFSSGFHLGELAQDPHGPGSNSDPQLFGQVVDALEALPLPTIAALQGSVFGGATDLALACDFRLGVHGMVLRMPAARLGLHYYASGLRRYVQRLGLNAAKRLFLTAETVPAPELLQMGYLTALLEPTQLQHGVDTLAQTLANLAPLAVQGMKQSLNTVASGSYSPADAAKISTLEALCANSADLREGLAAANAKREPRFVGR